MKGFREQQTQSEAVFINTFSSNHMLLARHRWFAVVTMCFHSGESWQKFWWGKNEWKITTPLNKWFKELNLPEIINVRPKFKEFIFPEATHGTISKFDEIDQIISFWCRVCFRFQFELRLIS